MKLASFQAATASAISLSLLVNNVKASTRQSFMQRNVISIKQRVRNVQKINEISGSQPPLPVILFNDEICDCFEHLDEGKKYPAASFATSQRRFLVGENGRIFDINTLKNSAQNMLRNCYSACPGEHYHAKPFTFESDVTLVSLQTKVQEILPKIVPERFRRPSAVVEKEETPVLEGEYIAEPSAAILSGVALPLIPNNIWNSLTGREWFYPSALSALIRSGIRTASPQSEEFIDWKAADKKTKKLLELNDNEALRKALEEDDVLVWIGNFKQEGYGSHLPLIKTTSILPLSPRDMADLLMDSTKVKSYNSMSLGRTDVVVFQEGVDSEAGTNGSGFILDGCAKIVRNVTKPPLSKKLMDFVTVMYARKINVDDNVSAGIVGRANDGYAVISRAVSGGKWGSSNTGDGSEEKIRSEILMGINLIRSIPGQPEKSEYTAVTHCNSPSVPKMLAGTVGVKGAIDFVKDIRALHNKTV